MKHLDKSYVEMLVERFLEGRTTNAEERELYEWFATADVPEEWVELKAMFAWYKAGMPESVRATQKKHRPLRRIAWGTTAIAASVALTIILWPTSDPTPDKIDIYAGSYTIENGIRYDSLEFIEDDIEALLARADVIENNANDLLAWAEF